MAVYVRSRHGERDYPVKGYDPLSGVVTIDTGTSEMDVLWAHDNMEEHGYRLIHEDGTDAQLEELRS